MNETAINWDSIPDVITKDQLYQICHISKSTALYLLRSGKIPCEYTGKKTRCYKIKKADVIIQNYYPLQTRTLQGFESSCPLLKKDFGKNYCPCPLLKKQLP